MAVSRRQMRLTERHITYLQPNGALAAIPHPPVGLRASTPEEYAATLDNLLPVVEGEVWVFAYGSLIWKPAFDFVETRRGLLRGWHRDFCLGWDNSFRGSDTNPALMLALDRGGSCNGMLYRLPPNRVRHGLTRLLEREMGWLPSPFPPRWVNVSTRQGTVRAVTFCIDRASGRYVSGLSIHQTADALAKAVGAWGSMAEYLLETVIHLEGLGIHDPRLWQMQSLVAERIEAIYEAGR